MVRDFTSFLLLAPSHGGVASYYREAEQNERRAIAQRGHYLISEQSNLSGGRLPDDFHLESDQPNTIPTRSAVLRSSAVAELNQL